MPDGPPASTAGTAMPATPPKPQGPTVVIGPIRITGWRAQLVQVVIFGALGAWVGLRFSHSAHTAGGWSNYIAPRWPILVSLALWVGFSIYWGVAAKSASTVRSAESPGSRAFHMLLINGSMLLIFVPLPGLTGRFVPDTTIVHIIGVIIQTAFLAFAIWARRTLGRNWSGNVTVKVDHELVRTGPYRRIRHPIYTAMFGMYAGAAITVGQVHSIVALGILMLAYARKMRQEELVMRGEFGAAYDDYRRHSWAVIPPVW
jgi:protein-S-isoprenylcysteine O-methyltransferase Ste14